jgi:hypothetical protein
MNSSKKKHFTVEEANQTLPLVRAIVTDIVGQFRDVHDRKERLSQIRRPTGKAAREVPNVYSEEVQQIEEELEKDVARLQEYVDELQSLGVEFKDFVRGLVDFPAVIDGREAYLCWQLGEPEVAYWHDLDAGFQGRQSLLVNSSSTPKNSRKG